MSAKPEFIARGRTVFQKPLTKGRRTAIGFPVLSIEEFVMDNEAVARTIAKLMNENVKELWMSKRYVVLALFALLATPAVAVDGQLSSQEILARNAARNEENAARLTAAGCPVDDDAAILALSDKEFERCMETGFVGGLAGASYLAASAARLDLEWDRELDRCRETIGCIVIEGRFRRD